MNNSRILDLIFIQYLKQQKQIIIYKAIGKSTTKNNNEGENEKK